MTNAIEKLPDLESLLGLDEKAQDDAERIRGMARQLRNFKRLQLTEELKDAEAIPGAPPTEDGKVKVNGHQYRSFKQQYDLIQKAHKLLWDQIETEGYRAKVEELLGIKRPA